MGDRFADRVRRQYASLSAGMRRVAEYLLQNPRVLAFATTTDIGRSVGVSQSTVIRLAVALGYSGFPQLQAEAREWVDTRAMVSRAASDEQGGGTILDRVLEQDRHLIERTLRQNQIDSFYRAVSRLAVAPVIYVTGARSSYGLAHFLWYTLKLQTDKAVLLEPGSHLLTLDLPRLSPQSVLVAFSFPRYSEETTRLVEYAVGAGAPVIAITDSPISPVGRRATEILLTAIDSPAASTHSYAATISLATALSSAVSLRLQEQVTNRLGEMEQVIGRWGQLMK